MSTTPEYKHPIALGPTWSQAIAIGSITDAENVVIVGRTDTADAGGSFFDVRPDAVDLVYLESPEILSIVSSNNSDTLAGTGANLLLIQGLDLHFNPIEETIELNGTTPVLTTQAFMRVNRMIVIGVGSNGDNSGEITATAQISGNPQCSILTSMNVSTQSNYTVPTDKTFLISNIIASIGRNDEAELVFTSRDAKSNLPFVRNSGIYAYESFGESSNLNVAFEGPTDFKITARAITNNPRILVNITGVLL